MPTDKPTQNPSARAAERWAYALAQQLPASRETGCEIHCRYGYIELDASEAAHLLRPLERLLRRQLERARKGVAS